jgi:hypothetical protein
LAAQFQPFDLISRVESDAELLDGVDPKLNVVGAELRVDGNADENAKKEKAEAERQTLTGLAHHDSLSFLSEVSQRGCLRNL